MAIDDAAAVGGWVVDWEKIINARRGDNLSSYSVRASLINEDMYRIGGEAYCIAVSIGDPLANDVKINSFLWAPSIGAAKRAYFSEIESDDLSFCSIPASLLPEGSGASYGEIMSSELKLSGKSPMEHASYRIATDGKFIHKCIETKRRKYMFRSKRIISTELPYAIFIKLY